MKKNVERFCRWMRLQHYSKTTINEYQREIKRFETFLQTEELEYNELQMVDIEDFIYSLDVSERTKNRALSAIKSFYRYLQSRGMIAENPAEKVRSIRTRKKNPVYLTENEYKLLIQAVNEQSRGFTGLRDRVIIVLLLTTGMRVSEIVSMTFENISLDSGNLYTLEIIRKGQEMDYVYLSRKISQLFEEYLKKRKAINTGSNSVFLTYRLKELDRSAVYRLVKKYFEMTGIDKKKMGPHVLRHTFATTLMRKDVSLYKIKELMNHKNISTTERYLHVDEEDLRDVVEKIDI